MYKTVFFQKAGLENKPVMVGNLSQTTTKDPRGLTVNGAAG